MTKRAIFIHNNYEPDRFPREPDPEDRFYTYGFGSYFSRNFKRYFPEYEVEMWRLDSQVEQNFEKVVQGVQFRIFRSKKILGLGEFSYKFLKALSGEVKRNDPIIFVSHVHSWLLYQVAFFFPDTRIVASHHGDWSPFFRFTQRSGFRCLKDVLDMFLEKLVLRNVDYFLVCDYKQIPFLKKAAGKRRFSIISTGIDVNKMAPVEKSRARQMLGWDEKKKYILYVGRLYKYKQPDELIKVWKQIKEEMPETELVIVGDSPGDEYSGLARNSGAFVAGRVLNQELNKFYSASDVYVLMSTREDYFGGIGIASLESLACNTPVVSNSLRNYIGDNPADLGETPMAAGDYKDAIIKVLRNPGNYRNMRESVTKHYSYESIAKRIEIVFNELSENYRRQ